MSIGQQADAVAGLSCWWVTLPGSLVLKLTVEGHWQWWRVLLPLWAVLGHNILYIVVGLIWLCFVSPGPPGEEDITIHEHAPQRYEIAALLCFLLFAHNLLERIEGSGGQRIWLWLGTANGSCP